MVVVINKFVTARPVPAFFGVSEDTAASAVESFALCERDPTLVITASTTSLSGHALGSLSCQATLRHPGSCVIASRCAGSAGERRSGRSLGLQSAGARIIKGLTRQRHIAQAYRWGCVAVDEARRGVEVGSMTMWV